jgi:phenol hydroxylase P5 protein
MAFNVEIEPTGDNVEIKEGQTLLDAALRQGVYLPHACIHGLCGTCKVEVLEGDINHGNASPFALMESERDDGFCLACTATATSDIVIEADIDENSDARSIPIKDIMGTVIKRKMLTPRILGLWIELDEEIDFQAGQYIQYHIPIFPESRAFSLANSPSTGKIIELNIALIPDGEATPWIHKNVKVGDRRKITGPFGRFIVRKSAKKPSIFFAGGSGLTSPMSMILDLLEKDKSTEPITLFYGARNQNELYNHDILVNLSNKHSNFRYVPVLSDKYLKNWTGKTGYLNDVAKEMYDGKFTGNNAYLCGPPVMIDVCITTLMQGRLFDKNIYVEKFFSKADLNNKQTKSPLFKI